MREQITAEDYRNMNVKERTLWALKGSPVCPCGTCIENIRYEQRMEKEKQCHSNK